jgi:hypothetical protein
MEKNLVGKNWLCCTKEQGKKGKCRRVKKVVPVPFCQVTGCK